MRHSRERIGRYRKGSDGLMRYIPKPLPPDPPIEFDSRIIRLATRAADLLGRLHGLSEMSLDSPNPYLFVYMFSRKEALYSSQIEGTQATLKDVVTYESEPENRDPNAEPSEVINYANAMQKGLDLLKSLPPSKRVIREIHKVLMQGVRGKDSNPGQFRTTEVHLGYHGANAADASYLPPPHKEIESLMDDFEKYLNSFEEQEYPYLIFCALLHGQFEMIHPFSDGNGRIGRLLVHLMLQHMGVLKKPILYLSYYFRRYRKDYYSLLNNLSKDGDWESWIIFFLNAVADVAKRATSIYQRAAEMRKDHLKLIERSENKGASKIRTVFDLLFAYPVVTAKLISHNANISMPAIYHNIQKLTSLGLLNEISGQSRSRMYMYVPLFELLESES